MNSGFEFNAQAMGGSQKSFNAVGRVAVLKVIVKLSNDLPAGKTVLVGSGPAAAAQTFAPLLWDGNGKGVLAVMETTGDLQLLNMSGETVPFADVLRGSITYLLK